MGISQQNMVAADFVEDVELAGHIVDNLVLPKVLDQITSAGGTFSIKEISIGQGRTDASFALIEVRADGRKQLEQILAQISDHGAVSTSLHNCRLVEADVKVAFPNGFYSTTNHRTEIRLDDEWIPVADQEMDCGIAVDMVNKTARCVPMSDVVLGTPFVVGHSGVRAIPAPRSDRPNSFEFMNSAVSTEKPKGVAIRRIAEELFQAKQNGGKKILVGGPAIIHTGSSPHMCELIRRGYVDVLLAGNALATHDIEQAMFGTSLGVHLQRGDVVPAGHEHHLRAINAIRRAGGIEQAIESGLLTSGVMYECVKGSVPFLLAGSIRDDGPLPEVITDSLDAQRKMRSLLQDASICLMIATTLHSIAVGNLLPAWVRVVCVDINPSTIIKLSDRGSFQTLGMVTDVEPFLRSLVLELIQLESQGAAS